MKDYKLYATNINEANEARDLFRELGYSPDRSDYKCWIAVFKDGSGSLYQSNVNLSECQQISLQALRDIVVLRRNNVNDATHIDQDGWKWFITHDDKGYVFGAGNADNLPRWDESSLDSVDLKPIQKPTITTGWDLAAVPETIYHYAASYNTHRGTTYYDGVVSFPGRITGIEDYHKVRAQIAEDGHVTADRVNVHSLSVIG